MSEAGTVVGQRVRPTRSASLFRTYGTTLVVGALVFLVGFDNGGFSESTRDELAIGLWWAIIVAVGLGVWPLVRPGRKAIVVGSLLAAFGGLTLLSVFWASSAEGAYSAFTRVALYLAIFTVAVIAATRRNAPRWCDGLALGIVGLVVASLVSRFFPTLVSAGELVNFIPGLEARLSYPVGYWNGLAMLAGLGLPLLMRGAIASSSSYVRGAFVAPIPALAAVIYLTSSRGGVAVALAGAIVFLACTSHRWAAALALAVAAAGSIVVALVLSGRHDLVNGPVRSSAAESQGRSAALIVAGICILTAVGYGLVSRLLVGRKTPPALLGWILAGGAVLVVIVGFAASHPARRWHDFTRPPSLRGAGNVQRHLLSSSGSGRWQFWTAAADEWKSKPLLGTGAGSYPEWWDSHASLPLHVENAHSLYAEALGELGIVGFLLIVGAFVTGIVAAATRLPRLRPGDRPTLAAALAAFAAYAIGAGVDWMWQLTVVSGIGIVCLGLAVGPGTSIAGGPRPLGDSEGPKRGFGVTVAALLASWLLICAIAIQLLSGVKLRGSEDAASTGNLSTAVKDALDSRSIESWGFSSYLQLALLEEQAGNLVSARRWIDAAISRDHLNWQLWAVASRIETKIGDVEAATASLERAEQLNRNFHP